ncbi:inositol monophosphatase family protein [Nocardioides sp. LHG3406-4]|uniref:inositol monophosphatase family protein n=1 Tax=Nocardioides sp. LHG3406-4 TaxID=2804575 RepID=UPI003CE9DF6B
MRSLGDPEVAVAAAEAGAAVVRRKYGEVHTYLAKSATDFATDADIEAEQAILDLLRDARPDDGFVGEESGTSGPPSDRTWLVDPLCGTLNFAARTPLVAVNVALREGADVHVAAAAEPFSGEIFWTDGRSARVRREGGDEQLVPSPVTRLVDINLDGRASRALGLLADGEFRARFGPRVLSTSLGLAWVAAGRRAAYVTEGTVRDSVHFAAGIALCEAAGCVVTDLDGGPLRAGAGLLAAADGYTHSALLAILDRSHVTTRTVGTRP